MIKTEANQGLSGDGSQPGFSSGSSLPNNPTWGMHFESLVHHDQTMILSPVNALRYRVNSTGDKVTEILVLHPSTEDLAVVTGPGAQLNIDSYDEQAGIEEIVLQSDDIKSLFIADRVLKHEVSDSADESEIRVTTDSSRKIHRPLVGYQHPDRTKVFINDEVMLRQLRRRRLETEPGVVETLAPNESLLIGSSMIVKYGERKPKNGLTPTRKLKIFTPARQRVEVEDSQDFDIYPVFSDGYNETQIKLGYRDDRVLLLNVGSILFTASWTDVNGSREIKLSIIPQNTPIAKISEDKSSEELGAALVAFNSHL